MTRGRTLRLGATVLLALVLLALLLQAGLHFQVSRKLNAAIESVAPFVRIHYADLDTSPLGHIAVRGLEMTPAQADGSPLRIDRASFEIESLFDFWAVMFGRELSEPPRTLVADLQDMEFSLSAPWLQTVRKLAATADDRPRRDCPSVFDLGVEDLRALGYQRLRADARLDFSADAEVRTMDVQTRWHAADMAEVRVGANIGLTSAIAAGSGTLPAFDRFEWRYIDHGMVDRLQQHCVAMKAAADADDFAELQTRRAMALYRQRTRAQAGSAIRTALRRFFAAPESLGFTISPEEVEWSLLHLYRSEELPDVLGLQLTVNGETVEGVEFAVEPPAQVAKRKPARLPIPELLGRGSPQLNEESPRSKASRRPRYQPVMAAQLEQHIGRHARIHTVDQKLRTGIIKAKQDETVLLERHLQGGSMSVRVRLDQIERIEVYTR